LYVFVRRCAVALTLQGCATLPVEQLNTCEITIDLAPTEAQVGDTITASGGPFGALQGVVGAVWDTLITVGGVQAEVADVVLTDCDACFTCRVDEGCQTCGTCTPCDTVCATCTQAAMFTVPELAPGPQQVLVFTSGGVSSAQTLLVVAPPDTDPPVDTDPVDTDPVDTDLPIDTDPADTTDTVDTTDPVDTTDTTPPVDSVDTTDTIDTPP